MVARVKFSREMRRNVDTTLQTAKRTVASLKLHEHARILDLGCGNGVFLQAAGEVLKVQYPSRFSESDTIASALTGVEINPITGANARKRMNRCFGQPTTEWDIRTCDALELGEDTKYDFIIGNPPWIRLHHLDAATRSGLRSKFITAKGAFDMCYLFIEKALRLLLEGGELAFVVPRGIEFQPAATTLRTLLNNTGKWSVTPLKGSCFKQSADVDPALLRFTKTRDKAYSRHTLSESLETLGDIATITNGVATGANSIFLVDKGVINKKRLEQHCFRPVIRGRNISTKAHDIQFTSEQVIWLYVKANGHWELDALSSSPRVREYLEDHRTALTSRPRLNDFIREHPSQWYRFIDPGRTGDLYVGMRIAMPVVFREPMFALVTENKAIVLNSCIEILPKPGHEDKMLTTLNSDSFWATLRKTSRVLTSDYRRTSVTELRSTPLTSSL